ncbi:asparagine--tRNA ligase [Candidatus Microgenomates bacterium]|nr:MAG: asparagine--tRNA ligase [Candidatus Microgenomates bacterium]
MKQFLISNAKDFIGKEVIARGWVFNKRSSGSIIFLHVRDGSGFLQATVLKNEVSAKVFSEVEKITLESSVELSGVLKEEKRAPGGYEITVKKFNIIHLASEDYPIGKKEHGPDFLLSHRHLWMRSRRQWAILRIRDRLITAINAFLHEQAFTRVDTPIITPSACEGTTTLFEIDYFGEKAYLSQSGQLYLEAAIAAFGRVYDFSPALRAEKSKTRRHLIEFWMMDAEAAFMTFTEMLDFEETMVKYVIADCLTHCSEELAIIERDTAPLTKALDEPFVRLTFAEAVKKLQSMGSDITENTDFGNDDETMLMNHYQTPVFVTHYPAAVKAFYVKRDAKNPKLALAADLLAPEGYGEVIGGGEREADYDTLLQRVDEHKLNMHDYGWYLDLRRYGSVPHSGFGLGLERLVAWICKLDHVRETIPFPRMLERLRP